jgi:hypothetical protein
MINLSSRVARLLRFAAVLCYATIASLSAHANPTVTGPIAGVPNGASPIDLSAAGYIEEEYFIDGTASAYTNDGALNPDGMWSVTPAGNPVAYRTRILVRRPADPKRFNGTVLAEWYNVTSGADLEPDWIWTAEELLRSGYAWVGISAQQVGVGTLLVTNPARYGSLIHPGDSFSYDMYSQAGLAIKYPGGVDPLGGLPIEAVIAIGESQSASRLGTYFNAIHPIAGVFDGFLNHSRGGGTAPLAQPPQALVSTPFPTFSRTDLSTPVLAFETEGDFLTLGFLPARQPDNAVYRRWELAGSAHVDAFLLGDSGFVVCDDPVNDGPQYLVLRAAIHHLNQWVRDGILPPVSPQIEIAVPGFPPEIARDQYGNALGGIRTPLLDVPTATHSGVPNTGFPFCFLFGSTIPFDEATLASLYRNHGKYVSAFAKATKAAVKAGFILKPDAKAIKVEAAQSGVGK